MTMAGGRMRARESSAPILYHLFVSFFLFLGSVVTIHLCSTSDIAARQHTHTTALAVLFEQVSSVFSTSSLFSLSPSQLYLSCGRSVSSQACGRSSAQQVSERIKMSLASWVHTHTPKWPTYWWWWTHAVGYRVRTNEQQQKLEQSHHHHRPRQSRS